MKRSISCDGLLRREDDFWKKVSGSGDADPGAVVAHAAAGLSFLHVRSQKPYLFDNGFRQSLTHID